MEPKFQHLQKEYEKLVQCNRCGFCETVCPTYVASGKETLSPRGRNQAFRQILEGKILNPILAEEIFSTCLTCHACTNVCFSEVPVGKLMASAKQIVSESKNKFSLQFKLICFLLSNRKILSILLWPIFLLKNLGFSSILKRIGILKKLSPELDAAEELLDRVPLRFGGTSSPALFINQLKRDAYKKQETKGVLYFSGCGIHYLYPKAARACWKILKNSTKEVLSPNSACCGLISQSMGDIQTAKRLSEKNIRELEKNYPEMIVVDDDSCCGFMKSYAELWDGDLQAVSFSNKVKNLSEFLVQHPFVSTEFLKVSAGEQIHSFGEAAVKRMRSIPTCRNKLREWPEEISVRTATYHDPCQMGNAHCAFSAPREILKNLAGTKFVEMEEANWCCGGAGTYCLKHPELAGEVLERKLANIKKSGAEIVLTQAASCLAHIGYGIRKNGWKNLEVMHLAEFLLPSAPFNLLQMDFHF